MKHGYLLPALFVLAAAAAAQGPAAAQHNHGGGSHGMGGHGQTAPLCPLREKTYEPAARNIENGVEITLTAKSARDVEALREKAAAYFASKADMDRNCPARVPGAKVATEEIYGGLKITITAMAPDSIKTLQAAAAYACAREKSSSARDFKKYVCPMGHFQSSRPGKCPQCGMGLKEKS